MDQIKWGVLGTGFIANMFADGMTLVPGAEKKAVTGINMDDANEFGDKYGFEMRFDDFGEMLEKAKPDIAYIAVPNNLHFDFVMKALDAGVHVLCEKPMADNMHQLTQMVNKTKEKNCFLMEGVWTRCFPATRKVREWIDAGKIGTVKSVRADFGIKAVPGWQGWKAKAEFSGGAIRDVGIYTISTAFLGYGGEKPQEVISTYRLKDGADFHSELLFKYSNGRTAYLTGSFDMITDHTAVIYGDGGAIVIGKKLWCPNYAELFTFDVKDEFTRESVEVFEDNHPSQGMQYEIAHVMDCIRGGKTESDFYPLSESMSICEIVDGLRKEWGVRYASDID